MVNEADVLAQIYAIILAWPDNEIAPDDAANDNRGQLGKEMNISFRSHSSIAKSKGGNQQKRSSDDQ